MTPRCKLLSHSWCNSFIKVSSSPLIVEALQSTRMNAHSSLARQVVSLTRHFCFGVDHRLTTLHRIANNQGVAELENHRALSQECYMLFPQAIFVVREVGGAGTSFELESGLCGVPSHHADLQKNSTRQARKICNRLCEASAV